MDTGLMIAPAAFLGALSIGISAVLPEAALPVVAYGHDQISVPSQYCRQPSEDQRFGRRPSDPAKRQPD
jgi:hypothetical protein